MTEIQIHGKKFVLPVAGGAVAYILTGVAVLAVAVFGGIFAFQWWRKKHSK